MIKMRACPAFVIFIMIKLKNLTAKTYSGHARYFVLYDLAAGLPERYKVLLDNSDDPIIIGRELDLKSVREVISKFEDEFSKDIFFGDHKSAMKVCKKIWNEFRKK